MFKEQKSIRSFHVSRASGKWEQVKNDYELLAHIRAKFLSRVNGFIEYFRKKMFFNLLKSDECTSECSDDDKSTINNKQRVKHIQDVC